VHSTTKADMADSDFEMQLYPYISIEPLHSETPDTERESLADTAHSQYWFDRPTDWLTDWSLRSNESSHSEALDTSGVLLADTDPWGSSTDLGAPYMPLLSSETSDTEAMNTETSDTTPEGPTADTAPSQASTDLEAPYMPLLSSETSDTEAMNTETSDTTPEGPTADTAPSQASTDLEAPYMPLLSSETSNSEAMNTETSDITPEEPTPDTAPSQASTDLEAQQSTSASTTQRHASVIVTYIGLCVLGLCFLLAEFTISHLTVIFIAHFCELKEGFIEEAHVFWYIIDTVFWLVAPLVFVLGRTPEEMKVGESDTSEGGFIEIIGAWCVVCVVLLFIGLVVFAIAVLITAVVMLWSALGWVLSSLGLL